MCEVCDEIEASGGLVHDHFVERLNDDTLPWERDFGGEA